MDDERVPSKLGDWQGDGSGLAAVPASLVAALANPARPSHLHNINSARLAQD